MGLFNDHFTLQQVIQFAVENYLENIQYDNDYKNDIIEIEAIDEIEKRVKENIEPKPKLLVKVKEK